jgi:hypothetical protein
MTLDPQPRPPEPQPEAASVAAQVLGVLLAPTAYLAGLQLAYQLVPHDCHVQNTTLGHLVHAVTTLVCLGGTLLAWRVWRAVPAEVPQSEFGVEPRTRFLGAVGAITSALFVLVSLAQWLAVFFLDPCQ